MASLFARLEDRADRLGIWWIIFGPGGVLATIYAVIAAFFAPLAQFGWAAVVLSAIGFALLTLFIASISMIAWRYFHPLQQAHNTQPQAGDRVSPVSVEDWLDAHETRLNLIQDDVSKMVKRQIEHISTPELARDLRKEIAEMQAALGSRIDGLGAAQYAIGQEIVGTNKTLGSEIQRVCGLIANQSEEILRLLDFAATHSTFVLISNIIKFAPRVEPSGQLLSEETAIRVVEYFDAVQRSLAGSQYASTLRTILHNAEIDVDKSIENTPAHDFPDGVTPFIARRLMIARRQLDWVLEWLANQKEALQGQMATQRGTLANLLANRQRNQGSPNLSV